MNCTYKLDNEHVGSYTQLVKLLNEADIDSMLSILFSLDPETKQENVVRKIKEVKKEYFLENVNNSSFNIDGEPTLKVSDKMTIQQFIDSHYFTVNGGSPVFKMVFDDYLTYKRKDLIDNVKMSEDQADEFIHNMRDKWEIVAKDAFDLHKLLVSVKGKKDKLSYQELSSNAVNTAFQNIVPTLEEAASKVIQKVFLKNGAAKIEGINTRAQLIKNINLTAELKGVPEEIVGHIDYLLVRDNGDIEIFNIKTSLESYSEWDAVKKEKYRYQMAIIKRLLEYNGIHTKNIRLNIIPVKLNYDAAFENVTAIDVENAVAMDFKDNEYILQKYDKAAEQFIASNVAFDTFESDITTKLDTQLQKIFPGSNIATQGIKETAKSWLDRHWKQLNPKATEDGGWEIKLPDEDTTITVNDSHVGSRNKEILAIIEEHLDDLSSNGKHEKGIRRVITDIKNAYEHTGVYCPSGEYGKYLQERFEKYFSRVDNEDGTFKYDWRLITNDVLIESGILLFYNNYTDQLDAVTLTTYDVEQEYKFKGRDHLLGYYLFNNNEELFDMKSTYGNIEAIRTMTVLNEVLPKLDGNFKLGELKVLGISHQFHNKKGKLFDFSLLTPQFDTVVKVVNKNTNAGIINNFRSHNFKYVEPGDILIQQWYEIVRSNPNLTEIKSLDQYISQRHLLDGTTIDGLVQAGTIEAKVEKLQLLIDKLSSLARERGIPLNKPEELIKLSKRDYIDINTAIATLYVSAVKALNQYYGDLSLDNEKFGSIQEYALKMTSIKNPNVRKVGFLFQKSIDKIASDMVSRYAPVKEVIMEFYEKAGYTKTQNAVIGNQASVYLNLYETDADGKRTMQFKNPYDPHSDLKDYERKFLKHILYEFHKIRCEMLGRVNNIKGIDDPKLSNLTDIPKGYFNAPLERASDATRRSQVKDGIRQWGKRVSRLLSDPKSFFEENQGLIHDEENDRRDRDVSDLLAYNPFKNSEGSTHVRNSYIADKDVEYFEFNVENLLIDYMEKHIQTQEFNKMLVRAKGIELDLILRGETEDDEEGINRTVKAIDDFLDINVFNKSIMGDDFKKIEAFLAPLRSAVSTLYVAGNIAGSLRDGFQGLLENISHAVIKFQTDINVKDVAFGYKEVVLDGCNNLMTMSKLNQFNIKHRLSNLDVARISEGQKTGRGGILNFEQWAYSTLRGPDYLNRMVLFVAKMNHDGCYNAYIQDPKTKRLEYKWRLDKRFNLLATNDKSNLEEYNKQQALYFSLIRAFNLEGYRKPNGEQLTYKDDLPDAYTLQEIQTFKTFADNIYGSYNKSTKAKYEHTALGRNFAFFSTWMNGLVDVYMKDTQVSASETKLAQETDYNGNLLFFTETGDLTNEDTGIPVLKGVPIMVQGVFASLRDLCNTFRYCGMDENGNWSASAGWKAVKAEYQTDPIKRRNIRRILRDLLIGGIIANLFKLWMKKVYQKHKDTTRGEEVLTNAVFEVLYKSSTNCFDTFMGPMAIIQYLGNDTNPATYSIYTKTVRDVWGLAIGEKTFGQVMMNAQALPRTFQDTYNLWVRDTQPKSDGGDFGGAGAGGSW